MPPAWGGSLAAPGAEPQLGVSPAPRPLDKPGKSTLLDGSAGVCQLGFCLEWGCCGKGHLYLSPSQRLQLLSSNLGSLGCGRFPRSLHLAARVSQGLGVISALLLLTFNVKISSLGNKRYSTFLLKKKSRLLFSKQF